MKCDKLFKEAFEGIEFRYKLDDTLEGLGTQKFTANQLEGYLLGKGVSPKEIKQSGIFDGRIDDNRALPADMWLENIYSEKHVLNTYNAGLDHYGDITLGRKGEDNSTYKELVTTIKSPKTNVPSEPHFNINNSTDGEQSLLGWRRTHIDEINGNKTLVLNEFQSDWAQTERAGRGTFESNYTNTNFSITRPEAIEILKKYETDFFNKKLELDNSIKSIDEANDKYWDDWIEYRSTGPSDLVEAENLLTKPNKLVADFPMSEVKHHQFQIVGAINDAIKEGIDTVAIPIQRENELAGSKGVTKFYESLNTKILPDIRKKLEKQGLKIKVDKKPYSKEIKVTPGMLNRVDIDNIINSLYDTGVQENLIESEIDNIFAYLSEGIDFGLPNTLKNNIDESLNFLQKDLSNYSNTTNDLWTLTIEEVPNGKVKWDVYSILTALGLGSYATQSEANTKISKEPSMEGKFGLSKRIGSKLNYNESDTEVADYFANIESGGDYNARNKGSSAFGKYQVIRSTLVDKARDLGISVKEARTPEGQEMVMHSLLSDYKARLKEFNLPVTKENMFVLHNLGQTGGVRVLRGTYTGDDIKAMRANVSSEERKLPNDKLVKAYTERYNINIPPKQES